MTQRRFLLGLPIVVLAIAVLMLMPLHTVGATHTPPSLYGHPHAMSKSFVDTQVSQAGSLDKMVYGGGPVMAGNVQVFLIFWQPKGHSFPSGYQSLLQRFFKDFGQSSVFNIIHQYTDNNGQVARSISLGGTIVDTTAFPGSTVLDSEIQTEVQKDVQQHKLPTGFGSIFLVNTPADEPVCFDGTNECSTNTFCGYHDGFQAQGQTFLYAAIPDEGGCNIPASPNRNISADGAIDASSHEVMETMSDALPNSGWFNPNLGEIGDPCAHVYGPQDSNGADMVVNGDAYLIQPEWSNAKGGCSMN